MASVNRSSPPEASVGVGVDVGDKSLLWKLSWIIGANMLRDVTRATRSGSVIVARAALAPWQVMVGKVVADATRTHTWPLTLAQAKPLRAG